MIPTIGRRSLVILAASLLAVGALAWGCALSPEAVVMFEVASDRLLLESGRVAVPTTRAGSWDCAVPRPEHEWSARFAEGIALVGYRLENPVPAADLLVVTLYWTATDTPAQDYKIFVHLLGPGGAVAAQQDGPPVGGTRPTSKWLPGSVVQDAHFIPLPPGHPPGSYDVEVGLYREDTGVRLRLIDALPVGSPDAPLLPERLRVLPPRPTPKATSR